MPDIARLLGVSISTIRRRMTLFSLSMKFTPETHHLLGNYSGLLPTYTHNI